MKLFSKLQYNSPVVLSFAFISFLSLILGYLTRGFTTDLLFCVYRAPLSSPFTYLRMVGHVLGHANLEHYVNNMMLFLLIGPMLEEKYGSKQLLEMIVVTALVTGLCNIILFPDSALLGASGIVFMMIVLSSITSVSEGKIPVTLIVIVILYLGNQVTEGIFSKDNISQLTHIIGGVCGGIYGMLLKKSN